MTDLDEIEQTIKQIEEQLNQIKDYASPGKISLYGNDAYLLADKVKKILLIL